MSFEDEHGIGSPKRKKSKSKNFIQNMDLKKGALRKQLGVKEGDKIPAKKLANAANSKDPLLKKRAVLAQTFRKMGRGK